VEENFSIPRIWLVYHSDCC